MADYTGHIPFSLAECNKCSALLPDQPSALTNHTMWHERLDAMMEREEYEHTVRLEQNERH